ncbi:MAG: hypothetical protein JO258_21180 [Alphaproteobacteria bacterium]|nr:hypothetical protein [Alphaproteobacteria bacterium]
MARPALFAAPPAGRLAAAFFCGAALWHGVLLVLGFLDLYIYPVAAALAVAAVALAAGTLRSTLAELGGEAAALWRDVRTPLGAGRAVFAAGVAAAALLLFTVKGLYPAGGHDYYNHYHGYYEAVIRTHGLWPNEAWYQFYYSKGMGLFFLATLLTDPLAPSLVTCCFAIAAAVALFLTVERIAIGATLWPWAAVAAFLVLYAYTPGRGVYMGSGGWGDFEKPHEIGAAFVVAVLWLCVALHGARGAERRLWFAVAAGCIFIVAAIELATVLLLGLFALVLTAAALLRRRFGEARAFFGLGIAGGFGLAGVLCLNYLATGLPSDQFALEAWPWANVQKLAGWGALPEAVGLMGGLKSLRAQSLPLLSGAFASFCHEVLRLDLLNPLMINIALFAPLLAAAAVLRRRRPPPQDTAPLWVLGSFFLALAAVAAAAGRAQPISFFRLTSFCLPATIAFAACGWLYIAPALRVARLDGAVRLALPVILLVAVLFAFVSHRAAPVRQVLSNAIVFATGQISIRDAYGRQQGWPGRQPWGGIFPGTLGAWQTAGPGTRIWSMHLGAYCMLPHCRSETFFSFILSPRLLDLLAASAEGECDILHREGLDYFFYTTAMDLNDILPLTQAFAPERIADYVGIKWSDGTSYLLTWLGPGVEPLTAEWVARYKQAVETAPYQPRSFPLALMLNLRQQLQGNPTWGRDLTLPGID